MLTTSKGSGGVSVVVGPSTRDVDGRCVDVKAEHVVLLYMRTVYVLFARAHGLATWRAGPAWTHTYTHTRTRTHAHRRA